ncbi:MAG: hypothetical protein ACRCY4_10110 [Brevinema sp.]
MIRKMFFFLVMVFSFPMMVQAYVKAWRVGIEPSLMLTDTHNIVMTNGGFSPSDTNAYLYIEEIVISNRYQPFEIFASFTKTAYSSHLVVRIMDAFTDQELSRMIIEEPGSVSWDTVLVSDRIYLIVELHGSDLQLRTVGVVVEPIILVEPGGLFLDKTAVRAGEDSLGITTTLQQDAKLTLSIFDGKGNLVFRPAFEHTLAKGSYYFSWTANVSSNVSSGETYYVHLKTQHPYAEPVELVQEFSFIP